MALFIILFIIKCRVIACAKQNDIPTYLENFLSIHSTKYYNKGKTILFFFYNKTYT